MDKRALIIDDEVLNIRVLEQLLSLESVETIAVNITSELEIHRHLDNLPRIDLIFLDLNLSRTTGFEIVKLLRTKDMFKTLPIIAYTVNPGNIAKIYEYGFDSILGKPLNAELFPTQLKLILNGERLTYIP